MIDSYSAYFFFSWVNRLLLKSRGLTWVTQMLWSSDEEAKVPTSPSTVRHKARCVLSRSVTHFFLSGKKNSALWLLLSLLLLPLLPTHTVYVTHLEATNSRLFSGGCGVAFWEIQDSKVEVDRVRLRGNVNAETFEFWTYSAAQLRFLLSIVRLRVMAYPAISHFFFPVCVCTDISQ